MSNSTASYSNRTTGSDRFYSPPVFRKLQQEQQKRLDSHSTQPDSQTGSYEPALSRTASRSNLDRLLDALTPSVPAHSSCEPTMKGSKTGYSAANNGTGRLYIVLEDLWESYREWSAYGVEVPVSHDGGEDAKIYYAPSLSAIQLYAERRLEEDNSAESSEETSSSAEELVYEFFQGAQPHIRPPLHEKARKNFPEFSSWKVHGGSLNMSLPVFALAAYKLRGSMLAPSRGYEWQKVESLLNNATDWLQNLQANHPDYLHFVSHSTL
ncbi:unnamed protein product [Sphenostylis stenocarpa]|uniref:Uncharacterized protein n=1 Tax=Sphenostylis stenocarpa TaxID=92480 RepID=A0AA86T2L5_9FABA|nr:unnamed protein product [Sphenostylis stenocarpa]